MNKKNKIQFNYKGIWFLVPNTIVKEYDDHGNPIPTTIVVDHIITKAMMKQYVTKKYPDLKVDLNTKQNHMGSHATVYYGRKDGKILKGKKIIKDIWDFAKSLQKGRWDPTAESYMPDTKLPRTTSGTPIEFRCKYVFCNNTL